MGGEPAGGVSPPDSDAPNDDKDSDGFRHVFFYYLYKVKRYKWTCSVCYWEASEEHSLVLCCAVRVAVKHCADS